MTIIETLALFFTLLGEFILLQGNPNFVASSYICFLIGNILWFSFGYKKKIKSIMILNIIFFIMGIVGVINWLK